MVKWRSVVAYHIRTMQTNRKTKKIFIKNHLFIHSCRSTIKTSKIRGKKIKEKDHCTILI